MVFEQIEQLKREYTDKYVIVDASQPELRRFEGQTGVVKTVNMNGNALVEFDANLNIGWYDISLDFLKVIDQPLPKPEPKKAAPKAKAAPAKAAPTAPAKGVASKVHGGGGGGGGGMSVADMLASARSEKGGGAAAKAPTKAEKPTPPAGGKMSVAEMLAAARAEKGGGDAPAAPPAKAETAKPAAGGKMSVAEMLAAARAEKSDGGAASAAPSAPAPEAKPEPVAKEKSAPAGELPKDVPGIVAYCRKADG